MKLRVLVVESAGAPSGANLMLCDENGEPLPNQQEVAAHAEAGGFPTISVRFVVDGKSVKLG